MEYALRITCPDTTMPKAERVNRLFRDIARLVDSEEMARALALFGGDPLDALSLREKIDYLNDFAEIWDYRTKQGDTRERWDIDTNSLSAHEADEVMDIAKGLGLMDITKPIISPDYILPLGGARLTNLLRPRYAHEISASIPDIECKTVALGSMRPISLLERASVDQYAPNAATEYEALCVGMEQAFSLDGERFEEESHDAENANVSWAIRKYAGQEAYVAAAPSSSAARRANSADTFDFFIEKFAVEQGENVLLVTDCIYVAFQSLRFMRIALERNLMVDCVGIPYELGTSVLGPTLYLQEIKATINAIKSLADEYL